jgi:hypothetical protein
VNLATLNVKFREGLEMALRSRRTNDQTEQEALPGRRSLIAGAAAGVATIIGALATSLLKPAAAKT